MKASMTSQFIVFIVMLLLAMIILGTAFGKGIVENVIGFFGQTDSKYLAEEFSVIATTVSNTPGDMKAGISISKDKTIYLDDDYLYVGSVSKPYLKPPGISIDPTEATGIGIYYIKKHGSQLSVETEGYE